MKVGTDMASVLTNVKLSILENSGHANVLCDGSRYATGRKSTMV